MTQETRIVEENTAADVAADMAAEAQTTVAQVVEAAVEAVETVQETANEAVAEVQATGETVAEKVEEVQETGEARAETLVEAAKDTVKDVAAQAEAVAESAVETVAERVSDVAEQAEAAAVSTVATAAEAVAETADAVAESVSEQTQEATSEADASAADDAAADEAANEADDEDDDAAGSERRVVRLSVGQEVAGVVKRITDFGAFVDIGAGRDGLVHISEMAVGRVNQVADVLAVGQEETFWIKKLDRARNRISLTLISPDTKTIKDIQEGDVVPGTVTRLVPYGAFVDIGVGTDALLHVREMGNNYVAKPEDVVNSGESLDVRIISVNRRRRRIDLSLKGLRDEPEPEMEEAAAAAAALGVAEDEEVVDPYENVTVLSPMELAFKRAMEAEGVEVDTVGADKRRGRRSKKNRAMQEEIIRRTLETMRE